MFFFQPNILEIYIMFFLAIFIKFIYCRNYKENNNTDYNNDYYNVFSDLITINIINNFNITVLICNQ